MTFQLFQNTSYLVEELYYCKHVSSCTFHSFIQKIYLQLEFFASTWMLTQVLSIFNLFAHVIVYKGACDVLYNVPIYALIFQIYLTDLPVRRSLV
jgi:hypothetical protein